MELREQEEGNGKSFPFFTSLKLITTFMNTIELETRIRLILTDNYIKDDYLLSQAEDDIMKHVEEYLRYQLKEIRRDNKIGKLIKQIKNREAALNEKLNKSLLQFGSDADIGRLIKGRRKILNISQDHLSGVAEVGVATLKRIELNNGNATIGTLIKILDTLGYEIFINLKSNPFDVRV